MTTAVRWVVPLAMLATSGGVAAQRPIHFQRSPVRAVSTYDGEWVDARTSSGLARARQMIEVGFSSRMGSFAILDLAVAPYIGRAWITPVGDGARTTEDGLTGRAALRLTFSRYLAGVISAGRQSAFAPTSSGGFVQVEGDHWAAEWQDRNPLLPMSLHYSDRDESRVMKSGFSDRTITFDRRTRDFRYTAHNWKTRLYFQNLDVSGVANDRPESFVERRGQATNTLRWGRGSRLMSSVRYFERLKDRPADNLGFSTSARLQHFDRVYSQWEWSRARRSGPDWEMRDGTVSTSLQFTEMGLISGGVSASRTASRSAGYQRTSVRIGPNLGLSHAFGSGVSLVADAQAGYTWNDQESAGAVFVVVLQERHIFGPDGRIRLENAYVDASYVVVQSSEDGSLFDEGFDYRLVPEGPYLAVLLLPGGRISDGTEVVVDYRYDAAPAVSSRRFDLRANVTLRAGSASLVYRRRVEDDLEDLAVPSAVGVRNLDQQQLGLQYATTLSRTVVSAYAGLERSRGDGFDIRRQVGNLTLGVPLTDRIATSVRSGITRNRGGGPDFVTAETEARVTYQVLAPLRLQLAVTHFLWDEEDRSDRFLGIGGEVSFSKGSTRVAVRADRVRRWLDVDMRETRLSMRFEQVF